MKIVVSGGTGFIGEPLVKRLAARGDDVAVLTRNAAKVRFGRPLVWDAKTQGPWSDEAAGADAVVNLAGENIGQGRWTEERKKRLVASRLNAARAIVEALRQNPSHRRVLVNPSAVGFYGDRRSEVLTEDAGRGAGFLAELCEQWERAAREAESFARVVILRFGVVLSPQGGALEKMLLPFKAGIGGRVGNGEQWMSWIDRPDVIRIIEWAIDNDSARGVYNATSPVPVTNRQFTAALGRALRRPTVLPIPAFALRILFGQMAEETVIAGQRVIPERAEAEGFSFESRTVEEALSRQFR